MIECNFCKFQHLQILNLQNVCIIILVPNSITDHTCRYMYLQLSIMSMQMNKVYHMHLVTAVIYHELMLQEVLSWHVAVSFLSLHQECKNFLCILELVVLVIKYYYYDCLHGRKIWCGGLLTVYASNGCKVWWSLLLWKPSSVVNNQSKVLISYKSGR